MLVTLYYEPCMAPKSFELGGQGGGQDLVLRMAAMFRPVVKMMVEMMRDKGEDREREKDKERDVVEEYVGEFRRVMTDFKEFYLKERRDNAEIKGEGVKLHVLEEMVVAYYLSGMMRKEGEGW